MKGAMSAYLLFPLCSGNEESQTGGEGKGAGEFNSSQQKRYQTDRTHGQQPDLFFIFTLSFAILLEC